MGHLGVFMKSLGLYTKTKKVRILGVGVFF